MKSHRLPLLASLILVATLSLVGCSSHQSHAPASKPAPIAVSVVKVSSKAGSNLLISGQVLAAQRADLSTRVMGTLVSLTVEEGQSVSRGQVLGQVRSTDVQASSGRVDANIAEAEAVVANAKRDLDRFEMLRARGSATQKELDDVRTGYARAQAQLEAARQAKAEVQTQLGYATLVAPFDGYVAHKFIQPGSLATPGMPIVAIEGGAGFRLVARVAEHEVARLKVGQIAQVSVDALGTRFEARLGRITPSTTFTGAQYEVTLVARHYPAGLKVGMYLRAEVSSASETATEGPEAPETCVWLPETALIRRGGLVGVFVPSATNEALLRWVRVGSTRNGQVQILSGLVAGEHYISPLPAQLADGYPIILR